METAVRQPAPWSRYAIVALLTVLLLWGAFSLYMIGQALFGAILICLAAALP